VPENNTTKHGRRLWESLLASALLAAAIGAIPQYGNWILALRRGVPANAVQIADEDTRLWEKNAQCALDGHPQTVASNSTVQVSAIVCPNGDILLTIIKSGEKLFRWIGYARHGKLALLSPLEKATAGTAIAATSMQAPEEVICQKWIRQGLLLRRVKLPEGGCQDEVVDTYKGKVMKRSPAPCEPSCGSQKPG